MKILITGAGGLLYPYLVDGLAALGELTPLDRNLCDLRDLTAVQDIVRDERPDAIVHAAAFTDVDGCERDPERARLDNTVATHHVVDACPIDVRLIYVSTDQVYPDSPGPHHEPAVGPVNVYGRTKLGGEHAALRHPHALVLRTNFFAPSRTPGRSSLSDVISRALEAGERFPGFDDSLFSPLHAQTLATHIRRCISHGISGVFNLGCRDGASKAAFARLIARRRGFDERLVDSTASTRIAGRARRALDLRMDVSAFMRELGVVLPTLEEEVDRL